jgi:hypothetical protein
VSGEVFFLGAGFSKAVDSEMPVLRDLGKEVVERLGDDQPYVPPGLDPVDFENWLSYLAEDQPWLLPEQQFQNKSGFVRISRVISDIIIERENVAKSRPMPEWLRSLISFWHESRASIITFNYDRLIESAYEETVHTNADYGINARQIMTAPVTPVGSRGGAVLSADLVETFSLTKLHGSRSWIYSGRDSFYGEPIYDLVGKRLGWSAEEPSRRDILLSADKVPLVIPPTSGKSRFFNNETVRSQWAAALRALRSADTVYFVGYSFPPSDTMIRFLLQESHHTERQMIIVNRVDAAQDELRKFVPSDNIGDPIFGDTSVEELAGRLQPSTNTPEARSLEWEDS